MRDTESCEADFKEHRWKGLDIQNVRVHVLQEGIIYYIDTECLLPPSHLFIPAQYHTTTSDDTTRNAGSIQDSASPSIVAVDTIVPDPTPQSIAADLDSRRNKE